MQADAVGSARNAWRLEHRHERESQGMDTSRGEVVVVIRVETMAHDYTPTPGDLLEKNGKRIVVQWVEDGWCGYAIDHGRCGFEELARRPTEEFERMAREQVSCVTRIVGEVA